MIFYAYLKIAQSNQLNTFKKKKSKFFIISYRAQQKV